METVPYAVPPDATGLSPDPDEAPRSVRGFRGRGRPPRLLSAAAAAAIVVGGYVHYCLYRHGYRSIPKIGTGFLIQVLSSVMVAGALVLGRERVLHLGHLVVRR